LEPAGRGSTVANGMRRSCSIFSNKSELASKARPHKPSKLHLSHPCHPTAWYAKNSSFPVLFLLLNFFERRVASRYALKTRRPYYTHSTSAETAATTTIRPREGPWAPSVVPVAVPAVKPNNVQAIQVFRVTCRFWMSERARERDGERWRERDDYSQSSFNSPYSSQTNGRRLRRAPHRWREAATLCASAVASQPSQPASPPANQQSARQPVSPPANQPVSNQRKLVGSVEGKKGMKYKKYLKKKKKRKEKSEMPTSNAARYDTGGPVQSRPVLYSRLFFLF
jgi:hypothetical protein